MKHKLQNKRKNEKYRSPSEKEDCQTKRSKRESAAAAGLPNYTAARDEHAPELVEAACKLKHQTDLTREEATSLKGKTFPTRRVLLTKSKVSLKEIRDRFPWLFSEEEVSTLPSKRISASVHSVMVSYIGEWIWRDAFLARENKLLGLGGA